MSRTPTTKIKEGQSLTNAQEIVRKKLGRFINIQPTPYNKIAYISASYTIFGRGDIEALKETILDEAKNPIYKDKISESGVKRLIIELSTTMKKEKLLANSKRSEAPKKATKSKKKGKKN